MMPEHWHRAFLAHARSDEHQAAIRRAENEIERALANCHKPYVSFSGGKDSTAMLHLIVQQLPEIMVYHWWAGPDMMPVPIRDEVIANASTIGVRDLRVETSERYTDPAVPRHVKERLFKSEYLAQRVRALHEVDGYDLGFVGIRAQESQKRKLRIAGDGSGWFMASSYPVGSWTWQDSWAYIVSHELPYPSTYDQQIAVFGPERARFGSFFVQKHDAYGQGTVDSLTMWRHRGPRH